MQSNSHINQWIDGSLFSERSAANQNRGFLIAVMNVEISKGLKDKIEIYEHDDDLELAKAFQLKHHLPDKAMKVLHEHIKLNRQALRPKENIITPREEFDRIDRMDEPSEQPYTQSPDSHPNYFGQIPKYTEKTEENNLSDEAEVHQQRKKVNQNSNREKINILDASSRPVSERASRLKNSSSLDVTKRLYDQGKMRVQFLKTVQKKAIDKAQLDKNVEKERHVPKIDPISNVIAKERRHKKKIDDYLYEQALEREKKRQMFKILENQKFKKQCSFRPNINPLSRQLATMRPKMTCEDLSRQILKSKCTNVYEQKFTPQLNQISRTIVQNKGEDFMTRNRVYSEKKMSKISKLRKQSFLNQCVKDKQSGKQLFKPRIQSRISLPNRNRQNKDVCQYLFETPINTNCQQIPLPTVEVSESSNNIVKNIQTKRIVYIFGELDSDQDGLISPTKVSIDMLPPDVLEVIMPILFQMEEFNFELNLEEFMQAIEALHHSLNSEQKSILYNYKRKKPANA